MPECSSTDVSCPLLTFLKVPLVCQRKVLASRGGIVTRRTCEGPADFFSALATADVLLTLYRADFGRLLGSVFSGLAIMTPGRWLMRDHETGHAGIS